MHNSASKNPFVQAQVLKQTRGFDLLPAINVKSTDELVGLMDAARGSPQLKQIMDQVAAVSGLPQASSLMSMPFGTPNAMPNSALPFYAVMARNPKLIETILAPLMVEEAYKGVTVGGDLATSWYQFASREFNAAGSAFNDYSNDGAASVTYNQFFRASYAHQTHVVFGVTEGEKWAKAGVDYVADNHAAAFDYLKRVQNYIGFYGVKGLKLWGGLTDPNLPAPISPTAAKAGGVSWDNKVGEEIYADILVLIQRLISQTKNALRLNNKVRLRLLLPPKNVFDLNKPMSYAQIPVIKVLQDIYPNLEYIGVPELETDAGNMIQMFIPEYNGNAVIQYSPSVPIREFPLFQRGSMVEQKKACGTFGSVTFYGIFVTAMLGI